jgi:hypothetical protein
MAPGCRFKPALALSGGTYTLFYFVGTVLPHFPREPGNSTLFLNVSPYPLACRQQEMPKKIAT